MKHLILSIAVFTLALVVRAQTFQVPVTPSQLEYSNFVFAVKTKPADGGTAFHVTITTKTQPIEQDCGATVVLVSGTATRPIMGSVSPSVQVAIQRGDLQWTADFVAPTALLSDPTADFIFAVPDYKTGSDGKRDYLPTDRIYEINLQSFLPSPTQFPPSQ